MGITRERMSHVASGEELALRTDPDESSHERSREFSRAPAEVTLQRAERHNLKAGHENAGFLSTARGYLPVAPPSQRLPPSHAAWDQLAAELPALHRDLRLRQRVGELPVLPADVRALAPRHALRACALLAIVSHAYWYVDGRPPTELPASLRLPWAELRQRLGRPQEVISYVDLVVYNWKVRDASLRSPWVVENMDLLFPTVGNLEERVFYLTQLEILARTAAVPDLVARAQGAALRDDERELEDALLGIIDCLQAVVFVALPKINPNPYGRTHVDPVVWAKTVAPFAVPFRAGLQGPSGTSSPLFNTLDLFFGRAEYDSFLGREIEALRGHYPRAWQSFMRALTQVSVPAYVQRKGSRSLRSALREAFELYAGETGFLGRHRMKVYGYLELAFKVGRSLTIGGFGGVFTDRTWDQVDGELSRSQAERTRGMPDFVHRARVVSAEPSGQRAPAALRKVTLDVSRSGVRYRGGDRCLILPENDHEVVARTVRALGAQGDEPVALTDEWRAHERDRLELAGKCELTLRELLRYGAIRPVAPRLAEALHARTQSAFLWDAIVRGCTARWELWELLDELRERGHDVRALWQQPGVTVSERLSRLVPPQRFRMYAVSSAPRSPRQVDPSLQLTVGQLSYPAPARMSPSQRSGTGALSLPASAPDSATACALTPAASAPAAPGCPVRGMRHGTASSFLARAPIKQDEVPFRIQHPDVFRLPEDPSTPIVMFAGGSGVAPFRAFLQERARSPRAGASFLFLSLRARTDLLYEDELASLVASGALVLEVAFTREGAELALGPDGSLVATPAEPRRIDALMLAPRMRPRLWALAQPVEEGGAGAVFYVCGRSGFADSVLRALKSIFRERADSDRAADEQLYRMVGDRRLLQELHSDVRPLDEDAPLHDVSELARHNDAEHGYWVVIDRVVYDLTAFIELHPGGRRALQAYAGMDASHGFARAHDGRADVDAMRETYRIGMLRTPSFDDFVVRVETPSGSLSVDCGLAYRTFVRTLQLVVEMQNALRADHSIQHAPLGPPPRAQDGVPARSAYQLQRAVETHRRFLASYLSVLVRRSLPELWCICQGLFFAHQPPHALPSVLEQLTRSPTALRVEALAAQALSQFEQYRADGTLDELVIAFEAADAWLLAALKDALIAGLQQLERHGSHVRERGARRLHRICCQLAALVRRYYRRVDRLGSAREPLAQPAPCTEPARTVRRLHTGTHWLLEEEPAQKLAVLRRSPVAAVSLVQLSRENERVLACLRPEHREYGLVVDTRQARMRNDSGFEDAMAELRRELLAHFARTAVLLESTIGELQVSRLARDERRSSIATRSESTALKFALGQAS